MVREFQPSVSALALPGSALTEGSTIKWRPGDRDTRRQLRNHASLCARHVRALRIVQDTERATTDGMSRVPD
jgi:hypothetical protein